MFIVTLTGVEFKPHGLSSVEIYKDGHEVFSTSEFVTQHQGPLSSIHIVKVENLEWEMARCNISLVVRVTCVAEAMEVVHVEVCSLNLYAAVMRHGDVSPVLDDVGGRTVWDFSVDRSPANKR